MKQGLTSKFKARNNSINNPQQNVGQSEQLVKDKHSRVASLAQTINAESIGIHSEK